MTIFAVFLLFLIGYVYFGYFALVILAGCFARRPVKKKDILPSVSLLIAAYNEEKDIESKLVNSFLLDYPRELLEIVVVSDASCDGTDQIVRRYAEKGVKLFRVEGRVGKTEARNLAVREAQSEIVMFSDATTEYRPDILKKLTRNFADPEVGMATCQLLYKSPDGSPMGLGQRLFWRYESLIKKAQTSLGTLTGSVGCATAFRRELYTELPPNIIEDLGGALKMVEKGYRVVYEEEAICYELATARSRQEWSMRVRVVRGGIKALLNSRKLLNPFKYPLACFQLVSHKVLRWLVPVMAIALFTTSALAALSESGATAQGLFWGQFLFYSMALFAFYMESRGSVARVLGIPQYLIVVNAAALAALYKTITTELETTWETERGT